VDGIVSLVSTMADVGVDRGEECFRPVDPLQRRQRRGRGRCQILRRQPVDLFAIKDGVALHADYAALPGDIPAPRVFRPAWHTLLCALASGAGLVGVVAVLGASPECST
jgi:hypothetical protein